MQMVTTTRPIMIAPSASMQPQPSRNPSNTALQAAYEFLAANNVVAANEARATPWPGTLKPVIKDVDTGPRGGPFYINKFGKKVYLKKKQKEQCLNGTLLGSGGVCPTFTGYAPRDEPPSQGATASVLKSAGARLSRGRAQP
nr:hypothetical protein [Pandoravirus aubagnensis]